MPALVFTGVVSTFAPWGAARSMQMQDVNEHVQGSEMALVWTILVAASALAWLLPVLVRSH
jgi:hypothetical protein